MSDDAVPPGLPTYLPDHALLVVMAHDGVSLAEALRRLVGYGELVFRTARLQGGDVLVRHGDEIKQIVLLDEHGDPQ